MGFYQSPTNKSYVDATNLKSVADIVEMRCSATTGTEQVHTYRALRPTTDFRLRAGMFRGNQ